MMSEQNDKLQGERDAESILVETDKLGILKKGTVGYGIALSAVKAALASDAEPVYQVMSCGDVWQEVSKETYDQTGFKKRVLYTTPPSTAQAVKAALRKAAEVAKQIKEANRPTKKHQTYEEGAYDAAGECEEAILALIPTEAAQVERDAKDAAMIDLANTAEAILPIQYANADSKSLGIWEMSAAGTVNTTVRVQDVVALAQQIKRVRSIASANREG